MPLCRHSSLGLNGVSSFFLTWVKRFINQKLFPAYGNKVKGMIGITQNALQHTHRNIGSHQAQNTKKTQTKTLSLFAGAVWDEGVLKEPHRIYRAVGATGESLSFRESGHKEKELILGNSDLQLQRNVLGGTIPSEGTSVQETDVRVCWGRIILSVHSRMRNSSRWYRYSAALYAVRLKRTGFLANLALTKTPLKRFLLSGPSLPTNRHRENLIPSNFGSIISTLCRRVSFYRAIGALKWHSHAEGGCSF